MTDESRSKKDATNGAPGLITTNGAIGREPNGTIRASLRTEQEHDFNRETPDHPWLVIDLVSRRLSGRSPANTRGTGLRGSVPFGAGSVSNGCPKK